ncbi:MAG TPA: GtrA family protein, partial [Ardenticatenaceae bacterium]|nr:GtrA family protein [Ardenticatenaceae bacterium]
MKAPYPAAKLLAAIDDKRREAERFVKFAVVGAIGSVVDFTVLNILVLLVGLQPLVANPFSFCAAVLSNFTWNRLWTFPESRGRPIRRQLPMFAAVNLVGLALNQFIFAWSLNHITPHFGFGHPLDYNLSKLLAIGV